MFREACIVGLEQAPRAINKLFDGANQGKLIIKVSEPPSTWQASINQTSYWICLRVCMPTLASGLW
jgi:hypothetical protein